MAAVMHKETENINLRIYFVEIVFGAIPATLTLPIAVLGSIFSAGIIATPDKFNMHLFTFCLVALGGLLGIIGLWWSLLASPFKEVKKTMSLIKICFLLLGLISAILLTLATKGYAAIIFIGPCIIAIRLICRQLE